MKNIIENNFKYHAPKEKQIIRKNAEQIYYEFKFKRIKPGIIKTIRNCEVGECMDSDGKTYIVAIL